MANKLRKLNPQLSKLAAQIVHRKHQREAAAETAELRAILSELLNRGKSTDELIAVLVARAGSDGLPE
jgi:hypothetical protein